MSCVKIVTLRLSSLIFGYRTGLVINVVVGVVYT